MRRARGLESDINEHTPLHDGHDFDLLANEGRSFQPKVGYAPFAKMPRLGHLLGTHWQSPAECTKLNKQ